MLMTGTVGQSDGITSSDEACGVNQCQRRPTRRLQNSRRTQKDAVDGVSEESMRSRSQAATANTLLGQREHNKTMKVQFKVVRNRNSLVCD